MGMSYRRAWLLADEINRMFQEPSIFTRHGGRSGGGAGLTPFGETLLGACRRMDAESRKALQTDLAWLESMQAAEFVAGGRKGDDEG